MAACQRVPAVPDAGAAADRQGGAAAAHSAKACRCRRQQVINLLSLCQPRFCHIMAVRLVPFLASMLAAELNKGRWAITSSAQRRCDARLSQFS